MSQFLFSNPPASLTPLDRLAWYERLQQARDIVGLKREEDIANASVQTLALLERFVIGELTLAQVIAIQKKVVKEG